MRVAKWLTRDLVERTAVALELAPFHVLTIAEVESPRGPFWPVSGKRPSILYERHWFHRLTDGKFSDEFPELSNSQPFPSGGYGTYAAQWDRLTKMRALDEGAAICACSWGMFQVLGVEYSSAGFESPQVLEVAMGTIEGQVQLFVGYVKSRPELAPAMRAGKHEVVARIYNGPGFRKNKYHEKIRDTVPVAKRYVAEQWR